MLVLLYQTFLKLQVYQHILYMYIANLFELSVFLQETLKYDFNLTIFQKIQISFRSNWNILRQRSSLLQTFKIYLN